MCLLDGRRPLITWKPTGIYSRINTRDCLLFRELNTKWLMLPRWLASTPIRIYGWEGSLTKEMGKTLLKRGNHFDMTSESEVMRQGSRNPH